MGRHKAVDWKPTDYGLPEAAVTARDLPLYAVNGVVVAIPDKQDGGCRLCNHVEQCELVVGMFGKWAALPCEGVLLAETSGEILAGEPDAVDGFGDGYFGDVEDDDDNLP